MSGWKVFAHDGSSPVRGGAPVWDGTLPCDLPKVALDTSSVECGAGWNYTYRLADALRVAGLWPTGRPSIVVLVTPGEDAITRGDKSRASTLRLERLATEAEIRAGIEDLSAVFSPHAQAMAAEQIAWRNALGRPRYDPVAVEAGVRIALASRNLPWQPKRFETARDTWERLGRARDTWAQGAWDVRDTWAQGARDIWDICAWDARDALTLGFASRQGWTLLPNDMLTVGLRDAYASGLEIAIPTGPNELGWAMVGR